MSSSVTSLPAIASSGVTAVPAASAASVCGSFSADVKLIDDSPAISLSKRATRGCLKSFPGGGQDGGELRGVIIPAGHIVSRRGWLRRHARAKFDEHPIQYTEAPLQF